MPIEAVFRLTSEPATTYGRNTREEAIQAALTNNPNTGTELVAPADFYPRLLPFTNDNNTSFVFDPPPSFLWEFGVTASGQSRGFATRATVHVTGGTTLFLATSLFVFADNAVNAKISIFDSANTLVEEITPVGGLTDGDLNPQSGIVENQIPPYGWQNIPFYTTNFSISNPAAYADFHIIYSFEVVNYLITKGSNPATLAFVADLYEQVELNNHSTRK